MSVALRLSRGGRKGRPFYRIVAADSEMKRDGRFIEKLGTFDPLQDPSLVKMNADRVKFWLNVGAKPSDTMKSIIARELPGFFEQKQEQRTSKVRAARKKRKARSSAK